MKRPLAVTFISYITIIFAPLLFVLEFTQAWRNEGLTWEGIKLAFEYAPWEILQALALVLLGVALTIGAVICAILMLKGYKIGRTLYFYLSIVGILTLFLDFSGLPEEVMSIAKDIIITVIYLILLYRRKVTDYFDYMQTQRQEKQPAQSGLIQ